MLVAPPLLDARRTAMLVAVIALLASLYMLTYSARIESGDSLLYFNAAGSLVRFGDTLLDVSLWYSPPEPGTFSPPYPLQELSVESLSPSLQPVIASGLYWLAYRVPEVGLVHTVWLLNVLVNAAAGGLLFLYALSLGYRERIAILGALILGVGTILWPYSKTFFRDPLAMFMVLLAALLLERLRVSRYRSPWLLVGLALTLLGALLTKISVVYAFPALLAIAMPVVNRARRPWLVIALDGALLLAAALTVFLAFNPSLSLFPYGYVRLFGRFDFYLSSAQTALHSYLFSIGGSVWGTSPVILLALPGLWILRQQGNRRYLWVVALMVLGYAYGYALLSSVHWFGGLSWPPRFLLPVIPFSVIAALPALDRLTRRPVPAALAAAAIALAAYSLWVQFSAVSVDWGTYNAALPPEAKGLTEWGPGLNELRYLRWVLIPGLWRQQPLDFVWVRVNAPGWPLSFALFILLCAGLLWGLEEDRLRRVKAVTVGVPAVFLLAVTLGLRSIYLDDLYRGSQQSLHQMMTVIDTVTQPGDVLVLGSDHYERFFLNYGKLRNPRVITLPLPPGERPGPDEPARVTSDNPDALLTPESVPMLYALARQHKCLWLLMDSGPFIPWTVRPAERFMSMHFYPVRELQSDPPDPALRLIEYTTVGAPDPFAFRAAERLTDLVYGEHIRLAGFDLPLSTMYAPGEVLPMTLYWEATATPDQDYTVAWKLVNTGAEVVAEGQDSQPGGGFSPTSAWRAGAPVWDNRAMRLPGDLPAGDYRLWVILYNVDADDGVLRLPVTGSEVAGDGDIGVLPVTIHVAR